MNGQGAHQAIGTAGAAVKVGASEPQHSVSALTLPFAGAQPILKLEFECRTAVIVKSIATCKSEF